jgi:hypothetical protein
MALPARTYVVCVGIVDYPGTKNDLWVSANDAKIILGIFAKNGKAAVSFFT